MFHLKEGDKAPDFSANDQHGNTLSLSGLKGKKVILFFYPKDDSPTCTKEACNFRDNYESLAKQGFTVIGVSADTEKSHAKFANKFSLPYHLLTDVDKKIVNDYGVFGDKLFMGKIIQSIHRITFVINEQGIIERIIDKVESARATEQLLEALA
ncbi:MAG: thioredoxin-dependent thiol peroxidase [Chitinophagales bacterium]|nr:thioredoxin-dependent thiol peroxidase [Chitinophagales bacterium]